MNDRLAKLSEVLEKGFVVLALLLYTEALIPLLRTQSLQAGTPAEGDPVARKVFLGVYAITLFFIVVNRKRFVHIALRDKLLLLLVGIALASILWSAAPEITLRRSVGLLGTTLFGVYLVMRYSLREQLRLLAWALGIAAMLSLLFGLMLPYYGVTVSHRGEAWRGIYEHKNTLGQTMTLGASVFLLLILMGRRYRWLAAAFFGLSLILLLLSSSATALVTSLTLLALLPLYRALRWHYTLAVPCFIIAILVGGGVAMFLLSNTEAALDALGRETTLTGRTNLWVLVLDMIWQRPWLGYGYGAFWLGWEGESAYVWLMAGFTAVHAHSGYLDLLLDLGLLGLSVFALGFLLAFLRAVAWGRRTKAAEGLWPPLYLTLILLYNTAESSILKHNSIFWVLYVTVVLATFAKQGQATEADHIGGALDNQRWR